MNLREFGSWALNQGSVANPEPNYNYKGQCVSLIQQYLYQVFGIPFKARGNAKDWANNADVLSYFNKLPSSTPLQPGDILVYGANYGGGYGHIALIDANGKFFDQNGIKSLAVSYRDTPFTGYICVLRSKTPVNVGNVENVENNNTSNGTKYKITVSNGVNFRKSFTTLSEKIGAIPCGTELTVTETYNGQTWFWGKTTYNYKIGWFAIKRNDNKEIYANQI